MTPSLIIILAVASGLAAGWLLRGWLRPSAAPVAVGHETPLPGRCGAPIGAGRYCKRGEGCNLRGHREATGRAVTVPVPAEYAIPVPAEHEGVPQ